ncbi:MFS transporter [Salinisphaera sp. Q1T1-3]|uniref:MFS transporter n=1 Tax=Salinisphaera sp. Q1T1-3 TaxID=2321229 RepID=UPI000E7511EC|nr:MFS transporter [Salinisphaera sp. Q1T1-3]RJS92189.1 MFS transporter [Salinisphaera sp. Q1T1-3]
MNRIESRAAFSLAGIFSLRMLGLFMIYPVFTFYAQNLTGSTPTTVGLALGAYGLTQAILQIPFGFASDRIGRKRMIALGLLIFAAGSVVAALSTTIYGVIFGRILQGAGAVGSTILALNADLTHEESRTKAMATIGLTIGLAFALALVAGPLLNAWVGVPGIFWFTALLAIAGIAVLYLVTPTPRNVRSHRDTQAVPALFGRVLADGELLRLDFAIFALHAILTASFIALPNMLRGVLGIHQDWQWIIYLPTLAVSVALMIPAVILAEAKRRMKPVFVASVAVLCLTPAVFAVYRDSLVEILVLLTLFFAAFNIMEASLPSLISKVAPADAKGTAMGIYSSSQFLGIFIGGTVGGWAYGFLGEPGVFGFCALVGAVWLIVAISMPQPRFARTHMVNVGVIGDDEARRLAAEIETVDGVFEAVVVPDDEVAYIKFDGKVVAPDALNRFARPSHDAAAQSA